MSYALSNKSEYLGKEGNTDWWRWTAYIACDDSDELDAIDYVEYHLHSSFRNPLKRSRHAETGFSVSAKGWGTFPIKARIVFKDRGHEAIMLEHNLAFDTDDHEVEVVSKGE